MNDRVSFILDAVDRQEPVLFLVDGRVWEGHIESCLNGTVVAVARPVGQPQTYTQRRWLLDEIADMGYREPEGDGEAPEDELFISARRLVEQAREYGEMSLAERLLRNRATREEPHGRGGPAED